MRGRGSGGALKRPGGNEAGPSRRAVKSSRLPEPENMPDIDQPEEANLQVPEEARKLAGELEEIMREFPDLKIEDLKINSRPPRTAEIKRKVEEIIKPFFSKTDDMRLLCKEGHRITYLDQVLTALSHVSRIHNVIFECPVCSTLVKNENHIRSGYGNKPCISQLSLIKIEDFFLE